MKRFHAVALFLLVPTFFSTAISVPSLAQELSQSPKNQMLTISDAYIRTMPPGQTVTAAFLRVANTSDIDCKILLATSELTNRIEFHEHVHSGGMMKMREKKTVSVDAGQIVDFSPGALHLMIFNVKAPLVEGNTTKFELQTDRCGDYPVELDTRSPLRPKMKDHH